MQTFSPQAVIERLQNIVGRSYVLTDDQSTRQYRQGRRFGEGKVLAVVVPGTLLEQWQVLQAAIEADCIVIMQAANTGLTGGSTPYGDDYDRPVLVMSTRRLKGIQVIHDGKQVICLPGATLDNLEQILKGYNREPHSVIGSSCIGASVL
ncbi:FAD-binding protein, partial [Acinetobacter baumannii]